jgi:hypothetical protein
MYIISPIVMGTRDANMVLDKTNAFESYFLRRYVGDLEENKPAYFLDAVPEEPLPGHTVAQNRHENYPLLASYVRAHYRLVDQAGGFRLYVRSADPVRPKP